MSQFMDWVLDVAAEHPDLNGAFVNSDGEWLDVLLADGRAFRFRPNQMIDESKPEPARRSVLNKLIGIGVQQADTAVAEGENGAGSSGAGSSGAGSSGTAGGQSKAGGAGGARDVGGAGGAGNLGNAGSAGNADGASSTRDSGSVKKTGGFGGSGRSPDGKAPSKGGRGNADSREGRPSLSSVFDAIMSAFTSQSPLTAGLTSGPEGKEESVEGPDSEGPDSEESSGEVHRLPIVRPADYFLPSHNHQHDDSMVYLPLTDFIGVGLADDHPDTIQPLFFSDLDERGIAPELGPLFVDAVEELRQLNFHEGQAGIELGIADVSGAQVFWLTSPNNYQSSWFADLDMAQTISESLVQEYPGSLPLFVPASRTSFFAVMADDPKLPLLLENLRGHDVDGDAVYPLPHTVASDGWKEWIPMSDHPAARILEELRTTYRKRIYDCQAKEIMKWEGMDLELKPFSVHHLRSGSHVSNCQYTSRDHEASLPQTDFVSFVRQPSDLPWDEDKGETITIRFHVALDMWPEGFHQAEGVWPPRWEVRGFPTPEQLEELSEAAHRDF
ncbi:MAG: hypothetical protein ACTH1Z_04490 [Ancrocorticia sp.]|uniref:hypothetical protein n=1 Tax=Ancrocorticia sp. TaxID=2593684 RepID=UPI003F8F1E77